MKIIEQIADKYSTNITEYLENYKLITDYYDTMKRHLDDESILVNLSAAIKYAANIDECINLCNDIFASKFPNKVNHLFIKFKTDRNRTNIKKISNTPASTTEENNEILNELKSNIIDLINSDRNWMGNILINNAVLIALVKYILRSPLPSDNTSEGVDKIATKEYVDDKLEFRILDTEEFMNSIAISKNDIENISEYHNGKINNIKENIQHNGISHVVNSLALGRQTGRTTRLVDFYIQQLFECGEISNITDHIEKDYPHNSSYKMDSFLIDRILNRITREHPGIAKKIEVNHTKKTIKINWNKKTK